MIRLLTLGTVDLQDRADGHQIQSVLAQPKRVAFLTWLALASPRGPHRRDTLLGIFWPDSPEQKARNALKQTVFVLRRALGHDVISNGESGIAVDPEHLWCDVWAFEEALAAGRKEDALDLYRGNFLEGFHLPDCAEFGQWVDSERARLQDLAREAVLSLSREMESAGNPVGAVGWLRRAREWAVHDEQILGRQLELQLALGDRSGAVREYESFARRMAEELELEPAKELRELLDRPSAALTWQAGGNPEQAGSAHGPFAQHNPTDGRRFSLRQTVVTAALAVAIGVAGALWAPRLWAPSTPPSGPDAPLVDVEKKVVILPFDNATGNAALDGLYHTAADEIARELARTGLVIVEAFAPSADERSGSEVAAWASSHQWTHPDADYLVAGRYCNQDGKLFYDVSILEAGSGNVLIAVDTVMGSMVVPAEAIGRLKRHVAGALAMLLDPRLSGLALVASHPRSFEAWQLLDDGLDALDLAENQWLVLDAARDAFLQVAEADSAFSLPLILSLDFGPPADSRRDSTLRALEPRRAALPPWERAMLDYHLALGTQSRAGQYDAMARVVAISPEPEWRFRLALRASELNRPQEALDLLLELEPERHRLRSEAEYWAWRINARLEVGDYESALEDIERGPAGPHRSAAHPTRETHALAKLGRIEEATERSVEIIKSTDYPRYVRFYIPRVLRAAGYEEESRRVAEVGIASLAQIDDANPSYKAAAYVCAGRFEEARQLLAQPRGMRDGGAGTYSLLAYMAAVEGNAEEAFRMANIAATGNNPDGVMRDPMELMSLVEVNAVLGDKAQAVKILREAFGLGMPYGVYLTQRWDLRSLVGYKPFDDLMRPKG